MYSAVLIVHSWIRWLALVAGAGAMLVVSREGEGSARRVDRWGLLLMMTLDVQLLLGLLLYFVLSPFTTEALKDMGAAMRNPALRFFAVEHVTMMLAAVVLVHVGRVLARKAGGADEKRMRLLICFGLALFAMLAGMPWPGLANGRPLFRV